MLKSESVDNYQLKTYHFEDAVQRVNQDIQKSVNKIHDNQVGLFFLEINYSIGKNLPQGIIDKHNHRRVEQSQCKGWLTH